jgi:16S rRNA (guanine(966)-N(2))-methyltransferase RsmD
MNKKNRHSVRILAGELKGRRLRYPDDTMLRPTMQRTRESLFDSIGDRIDGTVFIDLFAASGGVGIEAISRGASLVHFVESHQRALELLQKNLDSCGVAADKYRVHGVEVERFLKSKTLADPAVRIVFADPPYGGDYVGAIVAHFDNNAYAHIEKLIIEHRGPIDIKMTRQLRLEKTRRYGDTFLTFLNLGE